MLVIAVVAGALAPDPTGAQEAPAVFPVVPAAEPGQKIQVDLVGWPVGGVDVTVCGNEARRGSVDCVLAGSTTTEIRADGRGAAGLTIAVPPVPCPCVIRASTNAGGLVAVAPFEVIGAPVEPIPQPAIAAGFPPEGLTVTAEVEAEPSLAAAFGAEARRTLTVVVRNDAAVASPPLSIDTAVGRSAESGEPLAVVELGRLEPGAQESVEVPFILDPPAYGDYVAFGRVLGANTAVPFAVTTGNVLWGWAAVLVVAMGAVVVVVARRMRRMRRSAGHRTDPEVAVNRPAG